MKTKINILVITSTVSLFLALFTDEPRDILVMVIFAWILGLMGVAQGTYLDPTCLPGRTVIVHLFNWKWTDIALECERYLGPNGYCGVQVSPPSEHRDIIDQDVQRPWWERYQPISYKLESRSGTSTQFIDMVNRCHAVGVRIYADIVINHMCYSTAGQGIGSGGSSYDADQLSFPAVPYTVDDFNCCGCSMCSTGDCNIQNYGDPNEVRNCRLDTLLDLALSTDYVRERIAEYMNNLIAIGVGGFRIDAMKHMWPADVEALFDGLVNDLRSDWYGVGTRPFICNEVIDLGGEPISSSEYVHLGRVTEFKYSSEMGKAFRNHYSLNNILTIGESWGMLPSGQAFVFVDNHDNQRGHGAGGEEILSFWDTRRYKMAVAFTLAYDYGFARIMSSYYWEGGRWGGDWMGPPANTDWSIKDVPITSDGMCGDNWICEHRWRQINGMVQFRNMVNGQPVANVWDNGNNQIAFSRGNKGFVVMNNELTEDLDLSLQTGLPGGVYCDVISGHVSNGECTGRVVYVDAAGFADLFVSVNDEDPFIAIHEGSRVSDVVSTPTPPPSTTTTTVTPPSGYQRTVVLLYKQTEVGQDLFVRGGLDESVRPGCSADPETSTCAISMEPTWLGSGIHYEKHNAWRQGNTRLNWQGSQANQGKYYGMPAQGSPLVWTTNEQGQAGYQPVNNYGPHHWLLDVYMDCTETENGWFEVKGYLTSDRSGNPWEGNINQDASCTGNIGGSKPYSSINHIARCGYVNVFEFDSGSCIIDSF